MPRRARAELVAAGAGLRCRQGPPSEARDRDQHALGHEAASAARRTRRRQHRHTPLAVGREARCPAVGETAPAVVAHQEPAAGLGERASPDGPRAAHRAAVSHRTRARTRLKPWPAPAGRRPPALRRRPARGVPRVLTTGQAAPAGATPAARARASCGRRGMTAWHRLVHGAPAPPTSGAGQTWEARRGPLIDQEGARRDAAGTGARTRARARGSRGTCVLADGGGPPSHPGAAGPPRGGALADAAAGDRPRHERARGRAHPLAPGDVSAAAPSHLPGLGRRRHVCLHWPAPGCLWDLIGLTP